MIEKIVDNTNKFKKHNNKELRKKKGQFFTSINAALFMGQEAAICAASLRILDPGAGNGILGASVVKYCIDNHMCSEFMLTFIETDAAVLPVLQETVELLHAYARQHSCKLEWNIRTENFLTGDIEEKYDIIICNPPYRKIRKNAPEAETMVKYVYGQPNLYSLFMAKGMELLHENGRFVYITPRSWVSGDYYKAVRESLLRNINIRSLLLYKERDSVFTTEDVLQETMILCAEKSSIQQPVIHLYTVNDDSFANMTRVDVPAKDIKDIGDNHYLLLPTSRAEVDTIRKMSIIPDTFESLGYIFKTGPVVEFRNKDYLSNTVGKDTVPMYRSANISSNGLIFPAKVNKPQYVSASAKRLLIKNDNTVFLRRLSAKEERRRLQSCIYYKQGNSSYISIENHVNYLVRKDQKPLTKEEVEWIHDILMSEDYDTYYRIVNGSTQVNAGELNRLPLQRRA